MPSVSNAKTAPLKPAPVEWPGEIHDTAHATAASATLADSLCLGLLHCENQGVCEEGTTSYDFLAGFRGVAESGVSLWPFAVEHVQNHHCQCPDRYTGVRCEVEFVTCGDREHTCFHGARCLETMDDLNEQAETVYSCNCETIDTASLTHYAGNFCEHPASSVCDNGVHRSFCVNDGVCLDSMDEHRLGLGHIASTQVENQLKPRLFGKGTRQSIINHPEFSTLSLSGFSVLVVMSIVFGLLLYWGQRRRKSRVQVEELIASVTAVDMPIPVRLPIKSAEVV
ncbi:predicted protein [Phaeodactylum tricornutum CCAP 1055/1]|uniref:EGF-like domain-containing protein n=3 Tax=Phaeodactylum tricornutum TaxID=2850 RepID=B7G1A3_PHATC|nr:predicted protein [Phaeodactylum tricornutum CCAP 1055/1]EEC47651.1 predicted protein [Phaeodactylum tricornutum CCAP 1055/1]|eukprot:XP_002180999.1 predicted protein [Phaeodactylum tricornutum CCAP 1055/1]